MNASCEKISQAVKALESGKLVAFPTETVYGLGADAENPAAVEMIYALKGRPSDHPLIVHLAQNADLLHWASVIPPEAEKLIMAFWPGPLTLILKKASHVPAVVTAGQDTIGLRCPSHPVAQALLNLFKNGQGGIAAPSANLFGHVSPTQAAHVKAEFKNDPRLSIILDGGDSEVGIESTILDMSRLDTHGPVLLRPGHISLSDIEAVTGKRLSFADASAPRVSGTLQTHYAPHTPVILASAQKMHEMLILLKEKGMRSAIMHFSSLSNIPEELLFTRIVMPSSVAEYSHDLYASLRTLDELDADVIIVEAPPQNEKWHGVNDRLQRAAHGSRDVLKIFLS